MFRVTSHFNVVMSNLQKPPQSVVLQNVLKSNFCDNPREFSKISTTYAVFWNFEITESLKNGT